MLPITAKPTNPMIIPAVANLLSFRLEVKKPVIIAAIDPSIGKQLKPKIERTSEITPKAIPVSSSVVFVGIVVSDVVPKEAPQSPQNFLSKEFLLPHS